MGEAFFNMNGLTLKADDKSAARYEAPIAAASSVLIEESKVNPAFSISALILGVLVNPPKSKISLTISLETPAIAMAFSIGAMVRSIKSAHNSSISALVTGTLRSTSSPVRFSIRARVSVLAERMCRTL